MKRLGFKKGFLFPALTVLFLCPVGTAIGQNAVETLKKAEEPAPKSEQAAPKFELDKLKTEWEAVREQQVQMILEKEGQLEKLKEEIFAKMKAMNVPAAPQPGTPQPAAGPFAGPILPIDKSGAVVSGNPSELEAQKAALQDERQKFFVEMNRQKESLRQLQSVLDGKAKQLEEERARFEQEKRMAAR